MVGEAGAEGKGCVGTLYFGCLVGLVVWLFVLERVKISLSEKGEGHALDTPAWRGGTLSFIKLQLDYKRAGWVL